MPFGIDDALMLASVGSSLFSAFGSGSHSQNTSQNWAMQAQDMQLAQQQNAMRQQQMNLDAERRKRDIIRNAQVATAKAENSAANSGALNSSGIEGARGGISGQAGVNYLGVAQNQEIGNKMFALDNQRAMLGFYQSQYQNKLNQNNMFDYAGAAGSFFNKDNRDSLSSLYTYFKSL